MKVLVCQPVTAAMKARFAAAFPGHEFIYDEKPSAAAVAAAGAIFGCPDPELLRGNNARLRFIQLSSAGAEKYNAPDIVPYPVPLCCTTGIFGREIAEVMLACLLALCKHLHIYRDRQREHRWEFLDFNRPAADLDVLILGMGDIGRSFARMLRAFGCRVSGVRRVKGEKPGYLDGIYTMDELDGLLPRFDVVAMCLPDTPATRGVMTRERIFAMKPGAMLINVGRGSAADDCALCDALRAGHLSGAAVDVMGTEPLPPEHPAWETENLIITPHTAGRSCSPYIIERTGDVFAENFSAFLAGRPLLTPVDRTTGYMRSRG